MRIVFPDLACSQPLVRLGTWLAVILVIVGLFGCTPSSPTQTGSAPPETPPTEPLSFQASPTILPLETPAPIETPSDVETTRQAVAQALQEKTASKIGALLTSDIWLAEGPIGEAGESISREDALKWLNTHWAPTQRLVSTDYVEHYVEIEMRTSGWKKVIPLQQGAIVFHFHRFDAHGEPDGINGTWWIDTILYQ